MKKLAFNILLLMGMLFMYSCEKDNFDAPDAAMEGMIYDQNGTPIQMEQGQGTGRIRMEETSWSNSPIPFYLNFRQDGSYSNDKLFAATYKITPVEGAFYPVQGETIDVKGSIVHDFHVVTYLNVSWVEEPKVLPDGRVTASFQFSRNAGPNGESMPNLLDYQFFIATTQYVGNNNFDGTIVAKPVTIGNDKEHTTITVTSTTAMKYATTYWVRVGVRVSDSYKKYNYTDVKTVVVP